MADNIWEEAEYSGRNAGLVPINNSVTVSDKIKNLNDKVQDLERKNQAQEVSKPFKFPWSWTKKFGQVQKKQNADKILVFFFNKKNEIEKPMFVPVYSGNIIIYKNKAYEFDPRGIWRLKGVKGFPQVYAIREIDRRPMKNPDGSFIKDKFGRIIYSRDAAISNLDIDEVRARGDSTESDEFLIKAALKAHVDKKDTKPVNWLVIGVVIVIVVVGAFFLLKSKGGA